MKTQHNTQPADRDYSGKEFIIVLVAIVAMFVLLGMNEHVLTWGAAEYTRAGISMLVAGAAIIYCERSVRKRNE